MTPLPPRLEALAQQAASAFTTPEMPVIRDTVSAVDAILSRGEADALARARKQIAQVEETRLRMARVAGRRA